MATYAIGDVQGCHQELLDLLETIHFDKRTDRLWFTGDLVNRGPASLQTLRLARDLGSICVLGNHDLHLLAVADGQTKPKKKDTLDEILNAPDRDALLDWLTHLPLLHQDPETGYTMVHAGLPPQWDLPTAQACAREVEQVLRSTKRHQYFARMYGDEPGCWSTDLEKWDRYRYITNSLTRIRYCNGQGRLVFNFKGPPGSQPPALHPWYRVKQRKNRAVPIIFGHWATITMGNDTDFSSANVYPLDTGCVWGGRLSAMRLEDGSYFSVPSRQTEIISHKS
jgi:bis(5'-nucleosyl)-tetraphosphatase (symmetrical)